MTRDADPQFRANASMAVVLSVGIVVYGVWSWMDRGESAAPVTRAMIELDESELAATRPAVQSQPVTSRALSKSEVAAGRRRELVGEALRCGDQVAEAALALQRGMVGARPSGVSVRAGLEAARRSIDEAAVELALTTAEARLRALHAEEGLEKAAKWEALEMIDALTAVHTLVELPPPRTADTFSRQITEKVGRWRRLAARARVRFGV